MIINSQTLDSQTAQVKASPRLQMIFVLQCYPENSSQQKFNAIEPAIGTMDFVLPPKPSSIYHLGHFEG